MNVHCWHGHGHVQDSKVSDPRDIVKQFPHKGQAERSGKARSGVEVLVYEPVISVCSFLLPHLHLEAACLQRLPTETSGAVPLYCV